MTELEELKERVSKVNKQLSKMPIGDLRLLIEPAAWTNRYNLYTECRGVINNDDPKYCRKNRSGKMQVDFLQKISDVLTFLGYSE